MLTWIIYDITDDKKRSKIAKTCKEYGLYRVQKSAFLGRLNNNQIDEISLRCKDILEEKTSDKQTEEAVGENDAIYIFPMCDDDFKKVKLLGKAFDKDLVADKLLVKFI